jgi:hypothetical protein
MTDRRQSHQQRCAEIVFVQLMMRLGVRMRG